jgi:hypothetical protein
MRRWMLPVLILAVLALAAVIVVLVTGDEEPESTACNGSEHLCDRSLDQVSFAATHNSMSAADQPGWRFAQQETGIRAQLDAGIRGLLIDMHYAIRTSRGVQNIPIAKVDERLGRIPKSPYVYLCHTICGLGATRASDALADVREFLEAHPREVVMISIEDYVSPRDVAATFEESGLSHYVWRGPVAPRLPTLSEMVDSDQRVLVMTENLTDDALPWLHAQFDLFQETPYRFSTPAEVAATSSCRPNRGNERNPLFLLNNWVDTSPFPRKSNAVVVNEVDALLKRARTCEEVRDRLPNLVAVDFYELGDVLGVVAELNR